MKTNLYFCVEGHPKPVLVMIGAGSPYAVHNVGGKQHRTTAIVRDIEIGDMPTKDAYPAWLTALEAKHGPAALASLKAAGKGK